MKLLSVSNMKQLWNTFEDIERKSGGFTGYESI